MADKKIIMSKDNTKASVIKIKKRCPNCNNKYEKLHSCPYGAGIFGYGEKYCKCCKICQNYCEGYV